MKTESSLRQEALMQAVGGYLEPIGPTAHLLQPVIERAKSEPSFPIFAYRDGDGFTDLNAGDFYSRVRAVAKGLLANGVRAGDRVVLMSHTRLEWPVFDYAILAIGAVTVPAYETSSAEQLEWITSDSGAVAVILETRPMAAMFEEIRAGAPACRSSFVIDDGGLERLMAAGETISDSVLDERLDALTTAQLATIIYTSGTTGRPKGCALTHGNLRTNALQNIDAIRAMLGPEEVTLLFLPMAHSLTKIISLVCMEWGAKVGFATDMAHLTEEMPLLHPTMLVAVPRVFEKVYNAAEHKAQAEGHGAIFEKAASAAIAWSEAKTSGHHRPIVSAEHAVFDHIVYRKLEAVFGGQLRFAFSGGGPLGERLTHFFNGIGVRIFEGYGLTETSPTLTLNRADAWKPGTVGTPLAGTTIDIAPDGEILASGPQVFSGYWHNDTATAETFDAEGRFCTGDVGELDDEGFLRITGRKKELIVTAAGKNVAPAPLEDRLRAHPLISQAVVLGDALPFVAALLTLDEEAAREWADEHGMAGVDLADLTSNPELRAVLQEAVDDANRSVSRAESIRTFEVLPKDLSVEAGELTPTLKVRRAIVQASYADVIDRIYG